MLEIRPQPGPQESFLSTSADIAIYGGAAGGGKTQALLMEPLRHIGVQRFGSVLFRRTTQQIRQEGGMWECSQPLYLPLGGNPREQMLDWRFKTGARITFAGMEHERDRFNWDGSQITLIGFDQLEHFTYQQFFYMLARNRSTCGIRPYIRATCNPDPDSWLVNFLTYWIDVDGDGYPIDERAGHIRWFVRRGDDIHWADQPEPLIKQFGNDSHPLSVTFIPARVEDNKILLATDPTYLAKLKALPLVERERLLRGNWKIRPAAGMYFRRSYFQVVDAAPTGGQTVRYWDFGATEAEPGTDPDWTAGIKMQRDPQGRFFVHHVERFRGSPLQVEQAVHNMAQSDGKAVRIGISQDPGQAGKSQASGYVRALAGWDVRVRRETGEKTTRAGSLSAQAEAGNVYLVRGSWNESFLTELENFPQAAHDDQVDAASGAFDLLTNRARNYNVGGGSKIITL